MFKRHLNQIHHNGANIDFAGLASVINEIQPDRIPPVTAEDINAHYRVFISLSEGQRATRSILMRRWVPGDYNRDSNSDILL